jgi:hypothetical protein
MAFWEGGVPAGRGSHVKRQQLSVPLGTARLKDALLGFYYTVLLSATVGKKLLWQASRSRGI